MTASAPQARVAVVLLNYRGADDTLACLDSLLAQRLPAGQVLAQVVIGDNASPGDDWARLQAGLAPREAALQAAQQRAGAARPWEISSRSAQQTLPPNADPATPMAWLSLVDNESNGGFASGNNIGLKRLLRDPALTHVWLLNNDTLLPEDCLAQLLAAAVARPAVGLWGATVRYADPPRAVQALGGGGMNVHTAETWHLGFDPPEPVPSTPAAVQALEARMAYVLGASLFATRHWLDRVGLLSEDYFLYYEELDWALRGQRLGLALGYAPAAVVWHKEGASIGTAPSGGSALSVFHLHRSRLIFCRKHLGAWAVACSTLAALVQAAKHLLRGRGRLVMPLLRGTWAGLTAKRSAA